MRDDERLTHTQRRNAVVRGIAGTVGLVGLLVGAIVAGDASTGALLRISPTPTGLSSSDRVTLYLALGARIAVIVGAGWLMIEIVAQSVAVLRGTTARRTRTGRIGAIAAAIVLTGAGPESTTTTATTAQQAAASAAQSQPAGGASDGTSTGGTPTDGRTVTLTPVEPPGSVTQSTTTQPQRNTDAASGLAATDAAQSPAVASCGPTIAVTAQTDIRAEAVDYLGDALGREPSDAEADEYWNRCVLTNQATLTDPEEPEVVAPGSIVVLPEATEMPKTL